MALKDEPESTSAYETVPSTTFLSMVVEPMPASHYESG